VFDSQTFHFGGKLFIYMPLPPAKKWQHSVAGKKIGRPVDNHGSLPTTTSYD